MSDTFIADNGREFEIDKHGFVNGDVLVDVDELIALDLEGAMDVFAERLVGNELLTDISYEARSVVDGQIILRVTGSVDMILERRADDAEEFDGDEPEEGLPSP